MPRPVSRSTHPELALPVASLTALRQALAEEVGPDAAAHALRRAGFAAGDALRSLLAPADAASIDAGSTDMGEAAFWNRLADIFASRGWGRVEFQPVHPGVGMLESPDWVEADPGHAAERPSCYFTTGMLANLLGGAAGSGVAVLEAECRSRGDLHCRFLFGAPETLEAVYHATRAGHELDRVLESLV